MWSLPDDRSGFGRTGRRSGRPLQIAKVNVDEQQELAAKNNVRSLPTLLFFKGGEVKDTVIGAGTPKAGLLQKLEALE